MQTRIERDAQPLKSVLVTGANGGVGRILVRELAYHGFQVYAGVRSDDSLSKFKVPAGFSITPLKLDVTSEASIAETARRIANECGSLSGLVNLAGVIVQGPLQLVEVESLRAQFEVNLIGPFAVSCAMLPLLMRGQGRVINIGAATAHTTVPFFGAVSASKAALAALNDAMRMEFKPFHVDVALIEPGALETPIFDKAAALQDASFCRFGPERVALYQPAMEAARSAMAKAGADDPQVVADAVVRIMTRKGRPRARALVGKGAIQLGLLRHLPDMVRDSVLMNSLGIGKALRQSVLSAQSSGSLAAGNGAEAL